MSEMKSNSIRRKTVKKSSGKRAAGINRRRLGDLTLGDLGQYAVDGVSAVKELASLAWNVEAKRLDTMVQFSTDATGTITAVSALAQGSDYFNRDGDSVRAEALEVRATFIQNNTNTYDFLRVIWFVDTECRGALPLFADLLETASATRSPLNHLGLKRFVILRDSLLSRDTSEGLTHVWHEKIPLSHHVHFAGTGATAATLYEGNMFVAVLADQNTNKGTFTFYSRFTFVDN